MTEIDQATTIELHDEPGDDAWGFDISQDATPEDDELEDFVEAVSGSLRDEVVDIYFEQALWRPLLTAEQEFWLGVRLRGSDRLGQISDADPGVPGTSMVLLVRRIQERWAELRNALEAHELEPLPVTTVLEEAAEILAWDLTDVHSPFCNWRELTKMKTGHDEPPFFSTAFDLMLDAYVLHPTVRESLLTRLRQENTTSLPSLSAARIEQHIGRIEDLAEEALDVLVSSNLRLVVDMARDHLGRGVEFADLIQFGNMGLMRTVEKFDPGRGYRFTTYAYHWIRQAMTRGIADTSRTIRLPVHMHDKVLKLWRIRKRLQQKLDREPTPYEIAVAFGEIKPSLLKAVRESLETGQDLPESMKEELELATRRIERIKNLSTQSISLEVPIASDTGTSLGDLIENPRAQDPERLVDLSTLSENIDEALSVLDDRERTVLEMRFGLLDGKEYTLEETGKYYDVTRERIRQIEAAALRKLRHPGRSRLLRDYMSPH